MARQSVSIKVWKPSYIVSRVYVDEIWSAVYLGYAQGSRLSVDRYASYKLDGDARYRQGFLSRFDHREGVIPTNYV
jgi:hypothetical protein